MSGGAEQSPQKMDPTAFWAQLSPSMGIVQPRGAEYLDDLDDTADHRSGFEKLTFRMGVTYLTGIAAGGLHGMYRGLRVSQGMSRRLRFNSMLNFAGRNGARAGNGLGVLSMAYTTIEHALHLARGKDDPVHHVVGMAGAGILYKSTAGLRSMAVAGGMGLIVGLALQGYQYYRVQQQKSELIF